MQTNHMSFSDCEEFVDEMEYIDLLKHVVADTYRAGKFIEMYYLASDPEIQQTVWQIAGLPEHARRMVKDLVAMLSKDQAQSS